jgi:HK97 family phage prohead protease
MEKRDFSFKIKSFDGDEGTIEGDLAVYGNVDHGGDVMVSGACKRSIQNNGNVVPLLWQHRPDEPIGTLTLTDTPGALKVKGQLLLDLPMAQKARTLLKAGIVKGMSIGYDTMVEDFKDGVRYLKEVRLWEGSIVTFPMNPQAMVTAVKADSATDDDDEEAELAALRQLYAALQILGNALKQ